MEHRASQDSSHPASSLRLVGLLPHYIHGYTSEIEYLRFSPDGCLLASTAEWDTVVLLWDIPRQTPLKQLPFSTRMSDLAFSPDGTLLAISEGETVTLWDKTGQQCLARIPVSASTCAFSSSGKECILFNKQGVISFWDLATRRTISSFQALPAGSRCSQCIISPDLSCLALTADTNTAFLWLFESAEGEAIPLTTIPADHDDGLAFSPDGKRLTCLATPPRQRKPHIHVYNIQEQVYTMDLVSPTPFLGTGRSQSLAFSPDGAFLVAADMHGALLFWDTRTQQLSTTVTTHPDPGKLPYFGISALCWSPASQCLATGGWETPEPSFSGEHFVMKRWK